MRRKRSSSGGSSANAETLLRQTFTGTHQIRSGKANVQLRVDVTGGTSIRGPIQATHIRAVPERRLRPAAEVRPRARRERAGPGPQSRAHVDERPAVRELRRNLLRGAGAAARPAQAAFRRSQQEGSSQQHEPRPRSGSTRSAGCRTRPSSGTESVGGVQTDHISAKVDVNALLTTSTSCSRESAPGASPASRAAECRAACRPSARTQIEQAVKSATIDVWSGQSDHTLRKLTLALSVVPPERRDEIGRRQPLDRAVGPQPAADDPGAGEQPSAQRAARPAAGPARRRARRQRARRLRQLGQLRRRQLGAAQRVRPVRPESRLERRRGAEVRRPADEIAPARGPRDPVRARRRGRVAGAAATVRGAASRIVPHP